MKHPLIAIVAVVALLSTLAVATRAILAVPAEKPEPLDNKVRRYDPAIMSDEDLPLDMQPKNED